MLARNRRRLAAWLFACALPGTALAGPDSDPKKSAAQLIDEEAKSTSIFSFNYGPPAATSIDLLGLDTSKITPASTLGPFVLSIPSVIDGSGGQYAGIDLSPAWVLKSHKISAYPDRSEYLRSELLRLRLDFGLTNGADSTDASKQKPSAIAFGISLPLLQSNNPLLVRWNPSDQQAGSYFQACLNASAAKFQHLIDRDQSNLDAIDPQARRMYNLLLNLDVPGYTTIQTQRDLLAYL